MGYPCAESRIMYKILFYTPNVTTQVIQYGLKPEKEQRSIIRQLKQTVILLNVLPSALADGA